MPRRRLGRFRSNVSLPALLHTQATGLARRYHLELNELIVILAHNDVEARPRPDLAPIAPLPGVHSAERVTVYLPGDLKKPCMARAKKLGSFSAYIAALLSAALCQPPSALVIVERRS